MFAELDPRLLAHEQVQAGGTGGPADPGNGLVKLQDPIRNGRFGSGQASASFATCSTTVGHMGEPCTLLNARSGAGQTQDQVPQGYEPRRVFA